VAADLAKNPKVIETYLGLTKKQGSQGSPEISVECVS
jgi:hypothetical protein